MTEADVAFETEHVPMLKHIANEARLLAHEELAFVARHDAGGVLTSMLQHRERIVDLLIHRRMTDDSDDSAHVR